MAGTIHGEAGKGICGLFVQRFACIYHFWEIEKRIKRNRKTPCVCIELRKSDMFWDIAGLIHDKVISMDDREEFSDDLKEAVVLILRR